MKLSSKLNELILKDPCLECISICNKPCEKYELNKCLIKKRYEKQFNNKIKNINNKGK